MYLGCEVDEGSFQLIEIHVTAILEFAEDRERASVKITTFGLVGVGCL